MRSILLAGFAAFGLAVAPVVYAQEKPADPKPAEAAPYKGVKWLTSLADAQKVAAEAKKGLFIEFTAEW